MESFRIATLTQPFRRHRLSRRAALASAGVSLSTTLLGRVGLSPRVALAQDATPAAEATAGDNEPPAVPAWMRTPGAPSSPYGERAPAEESVVRLAPNPVVSFSPLADLHGTLTPNALFYEIHFGGIPAIDPSEHRLLVHGLVEHPTLFTMDDLKRFPSVSVVHFLECAGNSFSEWTEASMSPTVQLSHGWTSSAEWTGVPLATILREVGLKPGGGWLLAEGADAAGLVRSIPTAKAMADGLLVYAANGEDLRPAQGYPLRLLLPGFEGNMNIKWLRRLKVGTDPGTRGGTPPTTVISCPMGRRASSPSSWKPSRSLRRPPAGNACPDPASSRSRAWPGRDGDGSRRSTSPPTAASPGRRRRCRSRCCRWPGPASGCPWQWDGAPTQLQSRAIDETGYVQPSIAQLVEARGVNSFYHNNAIKTWAIAADGEVSNVYA